MNPSPNLPDVINDDDETIHFPCPKVGVYLVREGEPPVHFPFRKQDPSSIVLAQQAMLVHAARLNAGTRKEWWAFIVDLIAHGTPTGTSPNWHAETDCPHPPPGIWLFRDGADPVPVTKPGEKITDEAGIERALGMAGVSQHNLPVEWAVVECRCIAHREPR